MAKQNYINALNRAFLVLKNNKIDPDTARYLLFEMKDWTETQFSLHQNDLMPAAEQNKYNIYLEKAVKGVPPQYIMGYAWFYGRKFEVNSSTLIPRQDSESMIAQILADGSAKQSLLELGTGSGELTITLGLDGSFSKLMATDISKTALKVAQRNAARYSLPIKFEQGDLFQPINNKFDVIVFNPPYIASNEKKYMDKTVIDYEPHSALFAKDNGLEFYQRFFKEVPKYLTKHGRAYLEFGFHQQDSIAKTFKRLLPNFRIEFFQDLAGNPRFLRIEKKEVF